ncbi:PIN domain-containing protein [Fluviicola taffensis]|uniref:PIN domain-containing protein n=1 Tax=Fluviicola taffensis TaxID=191579 RepID=UPI0031380D07
MTNIIVLDTNILRGLGTKFYEAVDLLALEDYCYSSGSELVIPKTVRREFLDFYKREVIQKHTNSIQVSYNKLKNLERFEKIEEPEFNELSEKQISFIEEQLRKGKFNPIIDISLDEDELLEFLLKNRQDVKKDNTRDYLIWLNVIWLANKYDEDQIILISQDRIFTDNPVLDSIREKHGAQNIKVIESISSYLREFGFNSADLTSDLILKSLPIEVIKDELIKDKDSIPSHISGFYYEENRDFKLEKLNIGKIEIEDFYGHKDSKTKKIKIIAHVLVDVEMVFEKEPNIEKLEEYFEKYIDGFYPNTFDKQGRPFFNDFMLFHFGMEYDEKNKSIKNVEFYDFFPEESYFRKVKKAHGYE